MVYRQAHNLKHGGSTPPRIHFHCSIAQMVERGSVKSDVPGSTPGRAAKLG